VAHRLAGLAVAAGKNSGKAGSMAAALFSVLDHLVYLTPDIRGTMDRLASLFGVRAEVGGKHPDWGTMNALLCLGPKMYFEIMGPDPNQAQPRGGRPFGLDGLAGPRLATWAARARNLQAVRQTAWGERVDLGEIQERSRQRPDGALLKWSMTDLRKDRESGIVPFFIDWGDSPHPAERAPQGCLLKRLRIMHPEAERLSRILNRLGLDVAVEQNAAAKLVATLETPAGTVDIQ
jgi:hypothetical protein